MVTTPAAFEQLLDAAEPPPTLDLVQCDLRWLDRWEKRREELDRCLFEWALSARMRVRRVLLYDLPSDLSSAGNHQHMTTLHRRWVRGLKRDQALLGSLPSPGSDGTCYQMRLHVLGRGASIGTFPDDAVHTVPNQAFQALWDNPANVRNYEVTIEFEGPAADREPEQHLWTIAGRRRGRPS